MKSVIEFKSYKSYLTNCGESERGFLTQLAQAAGCQKSYLSACLSGKNNLTLDHALGIAEFIGMNETEEEYFFLLIEKEKASTPKLKRKLEQKMKMLSHEAYRLKNQQQNTIIISETDAGMNLYYSNWMLTAIHSLTSIDEFQTATQIALRLGINKALAEDLLSQLLTFDLVKKEGHQYKWNSGNLHLPDNSPWISNHHMNWRLRTIDNIHKKERDSLHYTVIQSMSRADFETLKKMIAHFIKSFNKVSDPSIPEEAFCFSLDFFKV